MGEMPGNGLENHCPVFGGMPFEISFYFDLKFPYYPKVKISTKYY